MLRLRSVVPLRLLLCLLAAGLLLAFASGGKRADAAQGVSIVNFSFGPASVSVAEGTTVTWTNNGSLQHTSTSDTGVWDSQPISPAGTFSLTFSTPGSFPYHCTIHPGMKGTINVTDGPLTAAGVDFFANAGTSFSGTVATFTDATAGAPAANFSANVDWGDGTSSAGMIAAPASGGYAVSGSHTYLSGGSKSVSTLISDLNGGASAVAGATASVSAPPCAGASFTAQPPSAAVAGQTLSWTAAASGCSGAQYQFWLNQNGAWGSTPAQPYGQTATFSFAPSGAGTVYVEVWVRAAGSAAAWEAHADSATTQLSPAGCSSVAFTVQPGASGTVGQSLLWTAAAAGCSGAQYEFWLNTNGSWGATPALSYGSAASFGFTPSAPGVYRVEVWVRAAGSTSTVEAFADSAAVGVDPAPCNAVAFTAQPPATTASGQALSWTAAASGCTGAEYAFWLNTNGVWGGSPAQPFGSAAGFSIAPGGGTYYVEVWVRAAGSTAPYDAFANSSATQVAGSLCGQVGFTTQPPAASMAGAPVTVTAVAGGCANPQYEFWLNQNGVWGTVAAQPFGGNASFSFTPAAAGAYRVEVWVHQAGNAGIEAFADSSVDQVAPAG